MTRFEKTAVAYIALWFSSVPIGISFPSAYSILGSFALAGAMPFVLVVLWLGLSDSGSRLRNGLEGWHWKVLLGVFVIVYSVLGRKWAGDVLNDIFLVDARYFGVSQSVLTWFALPFGIAYKAEHLTSAFTFVVLVASIGLYWAFVAAFFCAVILSESAKARWGWLIGWKTVCKAVLISFLAIVYTRQLMYLPAEFKPAVRTFAIWADFNEGHRCSDAWVKPSTKLVFLDGPMVLVVDEMEKEPAVKSCNFSRVPQAGKGGG